jgi:hypothetical protein
MHAYSFEQSEIVFLSSVLVCLHICTFTGTCPKFFFYSLIETDYQSANLQEYLLP